MLLRNTAAVGSLTRIAVPVQYSSCCKALPPRPTMMPTRLSGTATSIVTAAGDEAPPAAGGFWPRGPGRPVKGPAGGTPGATARRVYLSSCAGKHSLRCASASQGQTEKA